MTEISPSMKNFRSRYAIRRTDFSEGTDIGKYGSIAVTERVIKTLKSEWLKRVPIIRGFDHLPRLCDEFCDWYNEWRPHMTLDAARPDDVSVETNSDDQTVTQNSSHEISNVASLGRPASQGIDSEQSRRILFSEHDPSLREIRYPSPPITSSQRFPILRRFPFHAFRPSPSHLSDVNHIIKEHLLHNSVILSVPTAA